MERFKFLIKLLPLQYIEIFPKDKLIAYNNNPPKMYINFFKEQKNINKINCYSNEGKDWNKTDLELIENKLVINFSEKFLFRRGRINCSLNDKDGWKWLGIQFTIKLD